MKKIILGFILLLPACGQFTPFIDAQREAGQIQLTGQSTPDKVAICYNPLWANKDQIKLLAETECQKTNRHAFHDSTKWFSCRLVNPSTAFFDCKKF